MKQLVEFLLRHGYLVGIGFVFAEQIGLPVPSAPVLLAIGALAGAGRISPAGALASAVAACLAADLAWYWAGRKRGYSVLHLVCRIAVEPDSCVRRTEDVFSRHGASSLLVAKFVPGLSTAAPPLAGLFRMHIARFLLADGAGSALWAGAFVGIGYLFRTQLEDAAQYALGWGRWFGITLVSLLALYILWKFWQRRRFMRKLRVARITVDELADRLKRGEQVMIVDLRNALDVENEGAKLPSALLISPDDLEARHQEIPRDREIVLYCT